MIDGHFVAEYWKRHLNVAYGGAQSKIDKVVKDTSFYAAADMIANTMMTMDAQGLIPNKNVMLRYLEDAIRKIADAVNVPLKPDYSLAQQSIKERQAKRFEASRDEYVQSQRKTYEQNERLIKDGPGITEADVYGMSQEEINDIKKVEAVNALRKKKHNERIKNTLKSMNEDVE